MHYNEFQAVQLAKKLMEEESEGDEDEEIPSCSKSILLQTHLTHLINFKHANW